MRFTRKIVLFTMLLALLVTLSACTTGESTFDLPIGADAGFAWVQWIVAQLANAIVAVSEFSGGYYVVGLVFITLVVRVVGWPIYSKSTAMSANMQFAQPEIAKLQEKYAGRKDEASQRAMQQETMAIYKKYKINPASCLLPFLQMPIFIAMYQTVRRIPLTSQFDNLNYNFLWFNFKDEPTGSIVEVWKIGENFTFYLMAIIVGATMFAYQKYAMRKPDHLNNKKYQKTAAQEQSEKTMKFMTYFLTLMLTTIAFTNLGIAFYWVLGNGFQFFQTYINRKQTAKQFAAFKG